MASWRLENLKYLGVYEANLFQITHYAPIESFQVLNNKKYKFMLGKLIELAQPIELSEHDYTGLQQTLYTTLEHLEKSNIYMSCRTGSINSFQRDSKNPQP